MVQKMRHFYRGMRSLQSKMQKTDSCSEMKEKYYQDLDELYEQYDIFMHDIRHTMRTIAALSKEGNCEAIGHLIEGLKFSLGNIEWKMICSHKILNALFVERKSYADDNGVILELDIQEPLYLQDIEDNDLIVLMGNLLDNAIDAEIYSDKRNGILCSMRLAKEGRYMLIQIENSYTEKRAETKIKKEHKMQIGAKHGIGLISVQKVVKKYGGIMESSQREGRYHVKIILPVQTKWDEPSPGADKNGNSNIDKNQES